MTLEQEEIVRDKFARMMEENFLKNGMNATIMADEPGKRRLKIEYVLITRATVYEMVHSKDFLELMGQASDIGFHHVRIGDGYNYFDQRPITQFVMK